MVPVKLWSVQVRAGCSGGPEWIWLASSRREQAAGFASYLRGQAYSVVGPAPMLDWSVLHPLLSASEIGRCA